MCSFLQPQAIDPLLRQSIGEFLRTLQDPDLNVRRVALVAFNSAAHNKPSLVRDLLDSVLPQLYSETKVRVSDILSLDLLLMGMYKLSSKHNFPTLGVSLFQIMNAFLFVLGFIFVLFFFLLFYIMFV